MDSKGQGDWKKLYQSRAYFSSLSLPLNSWENKGEQGHSKAIKGIGFCASC